MVLNDSKSISTLADKIEATKEGFIYVGLNMKERLKEPWFMMFQPVLRQLSVNGNLQGKDIQVLLYLLSSMQFENNVKVTQDELAEQLQTAQQNIARSIKRLVEQKYIFVQRNGRENYYSINFDLAWKGKTENMPDEAKAKPKARKASHAS
jgi:DNA-binding MarR family transcriptional regulator